MSSSSQTQDRTYLPFRGVENDDKAFLPLNPDLGEIRCVILLPGSGDDPIECELVYTNIKEDSDTRIPYVALSYCWGDVEDSAEILLHGPSSTDSTSGHQATTSAPFRVTQNLHIALQALRNQIKQYLWIVALCINQQDPREKTHQVQLMGKIYSSAKSVTVWLGPEDQYSRIFTRIWTKHMHPQMYDVHDVRQEKFSDGLNEDTHSLWTSMMKDDVLYQLWSELGEGLDNASPEWCRYVLVNSFEHLASRPWWHRIWVIQEVLLAPRQRKVGRKVDFKIGNKQMRWQEVTRIYLTMNEIRGYYGPIYPGKTSGAWTFLMVRDDLHHWGVEAYESLDLVQLLLFTARFQASDPRDKIFALFLLATDTKDCLWQELLISPDYTKSAKTVFDDLVQWKPSLKGSMVEVEGIGHITLNGNSDWTPKTLPDPLFMLGMSTDTGTDFHS